MTTQTDTILDKDLEICDAHHHIWDFPTNTYLVDELITDLSSGHNVTSTIYMECGYGYDTNLPSHLASVGETSFVDNCAKDIFKKTNGGIAACKAIVGYTYLTLGAQTQESLELHMATSNRFAGVRHATAWDADSNIRNAHTNPTAGQMLTQAFGHGTRLLTKLNLSFDTWLYHPQIQEFCQLAKQHPNQIMVLDHLGGLIGIESYSSRKQSVQKKWKKDMSLLSERENVYIKLGGLAMPLCGKDFHKRQTEIVAEELAEATASYYLHAIDAFGTHRCMFESNFPVDKVGVTYRTLWDSFKHITRNFSLKDKQALFKRNTENVYCSER
ncbi:MAG: amidohydrolase family protein [Gammaproteobacteria bacterium]